MPDIIIIKPSAGEQDYTEGRTWIDKQSPDRNLTQDEREARGFERENERSQQLEEQNKERWTRPFTIRPISRSMGR